jgi:hypothetical protein
MFSLSASHSYRMSVWRCHERIEIKHVIYYCDGQHYQSFKILCTVRSIYRSAQSVLYEQARLPAAMASKKRPQAFNFRQQATALGLPGCLP